MILPRRRYLGNDSERATFEALHSVTLAAPPLRVGLTADSAARALPHLRKLLNSPAVALTDTVGLLAWDGAGEHHSDQVTGLVTATFEGTGTRIAHEREVACHRSDCGIRRAVVAPLEIEGEWVGSLQVFTSEPTAALVRATEEVAQWVSGQLELAELDRARTRLMEAEVKALRAQISPHFIYNSLGAIASFVRTDPDRARELLLEFADFTRYSFRRHGEFTTLAEELKSVERYLLLEQARFGERLQVVLQIAPEVLAVAVPFLCLQPLVENAVQHGVEQLEGTGLITIVARDVEAHCVIEVEDNGAGEDPERVRRVLAGDPEIDSVGLGNIDARLRNVFGDDYGLVVETAPGAGTKVILRVPKFAPGVHA